jgi:hypothetical protein
LKTEYKIYENASRMQEMTGKAKKRNIPAMLLSRLFRLSDDGLRFMSAFMSAGESFTAKAIQLRYVICDYYQINLTIQNHQMLKFVNTSTNKVSNLNAYNGINVNLFNLEKINILMHIQMKQSVYTSQNCLHKD